MIKKCVRCGKEFDRHPRAKYCWDCVDEVRNENQRRWIETHREQYLEYHRRYQAEYREQHREQMHHYRERKNLNGGNAHENYRTVR